MKCPEGTSFFKHESFWEEVKERDSHLVFNKVVRSLSAAKSIFAKRSKQYK